MERGIHMLKKIFIAACNIVVFFTMVQAEDTDIFGGGKINIPPNVLIIFDNSGSMADSIQVPGWQPMGDYAPGTTYAGSYDTNKIYYSSGNHWYAFGSPQLTITDIQGAHALVVAACNGVTGNSNINNCSYAEQHSTEAYNDLTSSTGTYNGYLTTTSPYFCIRTVSNKGKVTISLPNQSYTIATGNYVNYFLANQANNNAEYDTKFNIARKTVLNLVNSTPGVRFGLMIFNPTGTQDHGGVLLVPCQDSRTSIISYLSNTSSYNNPLYPNTWTPLAKTLAEAGLYFARQKSWSNSSSYTYHTNSYPDDYGAIDPAIEWRCQKNYVIIMTDGDSTHDNSGSILTSTYLNSKTIGDYDNSGQDETKYYFDTNGVKRTIPNGSYDVAPSGSDYLNDVAKFLYDNDLLKDGSDSSGSSFDSEDYPNQNITTFTIGFGSSFSDFGKSLLASTATNGHGQYYTTSGTISLATVFNAIMIDILTDNSQFVSPVVPVNRIDRTYADNAVYLGLFKPDNTYAGLWMGNIKKFGFNSDGEILDRNGGSATTNGSINDSALSAWTDTSTKDGMNVDYGGVGTVLLTQSDRNFLTFKGPSGNNLIGFDSTHVTYGDLGLSSDTQRDDLLNFVRASDIYAHSSTSGYARKWVLGDIIHSQPVVMPDVYGHKNVIFVGANDGFMHCFVDCDTDNDSKTLADDTVTEKWAFVPWSILPNLKYLPATNSCSVITGESNHDYYVDGSPVCYTSSSKKYVAFGLRRGGKDITNGGELTNQYTILDVTNYESPIFTAYIPTSYLGSTSEKLGQSWCKPYYCKIKIGASSGRDVLLIAGGYDTNQDNDNPGAGDSKGRAIFAYDLPSSTSPSTNLNFSYNKNGTIDSTMRYCMVDLKSYDNDDDGFDDTIYAPSLGGDLFVISGRSDDGSWTKRLLFKSDPSNSSKPYETLRKFLYAPGIAQESWSGIVGDWVYIGSGDRENASDETTRNRFYAIKYKWPSSWNDSSPLTDSSLTNMTDDIIQSTTASSTDIADRYATLNDPLNNGWFFDLEDSGEKMVSTPIVFNKVVYFTTFTPTVSTDTGTDKCSTGTGEGTGKLYAVNYQNGAAVFAGFHATGSTSGNGTSTPIKADRSTSLGGGIPSQPSLVVTQHGTFVLVGTSKGALSYNTNATNSLTRYYWLKQ